MLQSVLLDRKRRVLDSNKDGKRRQERQAQKILMEEEGLKIRPRTAKHLTAWDSPR